ncbi:MAG: D-glucuronyl C5-epimerase family protein [Candidatus Paceibacterota bacterium]
MRNIKELMALSRDFLMFALGKDYSHQSQPIGKYFCDQRCYYNDLRGKAVWNGAKIDGIPALKLAATGKMFLFPIDIFLYGLGSLDRYFFDKDHLFLNNVTNVARWMADNISLSGYFDNKWRERCAQYEFYSNNSCMAQGLALSFAIRVVTYNLCNQSIHARLVNIIDRIRNNMLLSVEFGGTCLKNKEGIFFVEFPRKDYNIVLNGWIFAVFGLFDFIHYKKDVEVEMVFNSTVKTMSMILPDYHLSCGWAYYDNMGRICSPFYQNLHIVLLEALYGITGLEIFAEYCNKAKNANSIINRLRFTITKMAEKLFKDKEAYSSV